MNFYTIIYLMILFIIIYTMLLVMRLFIIPIRGVWPNMPPVIHKKAAQGIWSGMNQIMGYILMFLAIMYIIWVIIRKVVPNVPIPFRKILLRMTPIKELDKSGLFGLIDAIVKIVPRIFRGKAKEGFRELAGAILTFLKNSSGMILDLFGPLGKRYGGDTERGAEPEMATKDEEDPEESNRPSYLNEEQNQMVQQQYEQCLEEKTTPIHPEMGVVERQQAILNNTLAKTTCDIQRFRTSSDMLMA